MELKFLRTIFTVLLLGIIISCNPKIDLKKIVPHEVDDFALLFIRDIQQHKIEESLLRVAENMQGEEGRIFISNVATGISMLPLDSLSMINAQATTMMGGSGFTNYIVEYEQELDEQSIYFLFNILKKDGKLSITGFDARWIETPLKEMHAFTFRGKSIMHYIVFILAIASIGFILFSLVAVIRTTITRKWLWIVGILFAFIKFQLNWTTGELEFHPISFQLFGAGFSKSGMVAPWMLKFSIPVFAILFWVKKYQMDKEEAEEIKRTGVMAKPGETIETQNG